MEFTKFIKQENSLRIEITEDGRQEYQELKENHPEWHIDDFLSELIEYHLCNGWTWINPEETFVGLTSCYLILADEITYNEDENDIESVDNFYYYGDYMVCDPLEQLLKCGYIELQKA